MGHETDLLDHLTALGETVTRIQTKDVFHKWIDELPEDAIGFACVESDKLGHFIYGYIGPITVGNSNWLVDHFKSYLIAKTPTSEPEE